MSNDKPRGLYGRNYSTSDFQKLKTTQEIFILDICEGLWRTPGAQVYVSNARFAETLGCSEATIRRAIKNLEDLGYIRRVKISSTKREIVPGGQITLSCVSTEDECRSDMTTSDSHARPSVIVTDDPLRTSKDKTSKKKTNTPIVPFFEKSEETENLEMEHYRLALCQLTFPAGWDVEEARRALLKWFKFRIRENKPRYNSVITLQAAIDRFKQNKLETFIECCEKSEANNWGSLYAPKDLKTRRELLKEKHEQKMAALRAKDPARYDAGERLAQGTGTLEDHRLCQTMPEPGCWVNEAGEVQWHVPEDFKL